MNGYELTRSWFDFAFENSKKVTPTHGILYLYCIDHCNRLGWKKEFGLPTTMTMEVIGVRSYNTYISALSQLVEWGFIELISKSTNQYTANIIALSNFDKAQYKALDKALVRHSTKQLRSTVQSIDSIVKPLNLETKKPLNNKTHLELDFPFSSQTFMNVWNQLIKQPKWKKKTPEALQASLDIMKPYNETEAIQIMKNSIAGNWQGVFDLKVRIPEVKPQQTTVDFMRYDKYDEYLKKCKEVNFTPIPESEFWKPQY